MELSDALRRLAETQLGVVTRRQLRDGGMTAGEIRWAIGRQCRVLLPGVLLLQPELPTTEQRRVAALLLAGPGSWLAGPAALDAHRLRQERASALVRVYVPPTDVGMAVMVHGRVFHAGTLDWDATVESDGDLSAARVVVVGVTPTALARDPHTVLRRVEHAYETARRSGLRAPVVAERRHTAVARPIVM